MRGDTQAGSPDEKMMARVESEFGCSDGGRVDTAESVTAKAQFVREHDRGESMARWANRERMRR